MNLNSLEATLKNEPPYRQQQSREALFKHLIEDWDEATNLPINLRKELEQKCPLNISAILFSSEDKRTAKAVISLNDGLKIETVLMRHADNRNTVCVSSQIGCPLKCGFCATGQMGFERNLCAEEIIEQILYFARYLKKENQRISNIVFMGMGEPFLNYDNVISAIKIINDKNGFNIGARHISISTIGIIEGVEKLAGEPLQINLAISLHAPNNKLRFELVPANKQYPIEKILKAVDKYIAKTNRQVMFEYLMIKNINDAPAQAMELAKLMKNKLYVVNLIAYNPLNRATSAIEQHQTETFQPSSVIQIKKFKNILIEKGIKVTERYRFGRDIQAACGQLIQK